VTKLLQGVLFPPQRRSPIERSHEEVVHTKTVLVVDDDKIVRELLATVLAEAGYDVRTVGDGVAALDALAGADADLVLLDQHLPGLTGVEVLRRLRATPAGRTLPVILVTGADAVDDRVNGLAAGANDYVVKPFSSDELLARVRAQLRGNDVWQQVIDAHLEERATVARVLEEAAHAGTLEERATAVCEALADIPFARGATLVLFEGETLASVVATSGDAPWTARPGESLPAALSRYLVLRTAVGAWLDHGSGVEVSARLLQRGVCACAPLGSRHDEDDIWGVLALAVRGDPSRVLAASVDFATVALALLRPELDARRRTSNDRVVIEAILRESTFTPFFQPVIDLTDDAMPIVGYEALTRFADGSSPEVRFRQAATIGLGLELERTTLERHLRAARHLPSSTTEPAWVAVNVSPRLVLEDDIGPLLATADRPVVLELSEQEAVDDYRKLRAAVEHIGPDIRLSVDDAGSGFASLRHILLLQPEFVKLDRSWVESVDSDVARQALIAGLQSFCNRTSASLIAEGIETERERQTIHDLGVSYGQGFLLGRPIAAR
jgi:EAL domain-containing protein (putative c-di-GMP-specific phosphodiesterase class I)/DNA-binding response OmpR family regulator